MPEAVLDDEMIEAMQGKVGADLRIEHSTNNRELAAVLVEKAAALKTQLDEASPPRDLSPRAPDVAPEL